MLAGAGIGLLSGILVTNYNPFRQSNLAAKIEPRHLSIPQFGQTNGLGILKT
jgi:hypothetical protein